MSKQDFLRAANEFRKHGHVKNPLNPHHVLGVVQEGAGQEVRAPPGPEKAAERAADRRGSASEPHTFMGPWASPTPQDADRAAGGAGPTPEQRSRFLHEEASRAQIKVHLLDRGGFELLPGEERTVFHQREERDTLGRSYMFVDEDLQGEADALYPSPPGPAPDAQSPSSLSLSSPTGPGGDWGPATAVPLYRANRSLLTNYAPRKPVWTFSGHTKGVNVVKFMPRYGNLLISGSQDGRVKLWKSWPEEAGGSNSNNSGAPEDPSSSLLPPPCSAPS